METNNFAFLFIALFIGFILDLARSAQRKNVDRIIVLLHGSSWLASGVIAIYGIAHKTQSLHVIAIAVLSPQIGRFLGDIYLNHCQKEELAAAGMRELERNSY